MFKDEDDLRKLIAGLEIDTRPDPTHRQNLRRQMLSVFDQAKQAKPAIAQPAETRHNITSTIRASRIARVAAAAVLVIIAITALESLLERVQITSPVYGITDVPLLIKKARTIHIKMWTTGFRQPVFGEQGRRHYIEEWIDIEKGRFYKGGFGGVRLISDDKEGLVRLGFIFDGRYRLQVNHSFKAAQFYELTEFQKRLSIRQMVDEFLRRTSLTGQELTRFSKIGQDQIDSLPFDVWEIDFPSAVPETEGKGKYWVSRSTGELAKIETWTKSKDTAGQWQKTGESIIEYNLTPPAGIFETVVPEGYKSSNTRETAIKEKLVAAPIKDNAESAVAVMIALTDGTIIMAWNDKDVTPDSTIAQRIRSLQPGEKMPNMPVEISLRFINRWPPYEQVDVSYTARYLAHTTKTDKLYLWTIYVPYGDIVPQFGSTFAEIICRIHSQNGAQPQVTERRRGAYLLKMEENEFDTWVRGAMAELSDFGDGPDYVTFHFVAALADEIRASMHK